MTYSTTSLNIIYKLASHSLTSFVGILYISVYLSFQGVGTLVGKLIIPNKRIKLLIQFHFLSIVFIISFSGIRDKDFTNPSLNFWIEVLKQDYESDCLTLTY